MATKYTFTFYLIFFLTLIVISFELLNAVQYKSVLSEGSYGMSSAPSVEKMAQNNKKEYFQSQITGTNNRIGTVLIDMVKTIFLIFLSLLFLNKTLQNKVLEISNRNISFINRDFRDLKKREINFISIIFALYVFAKIVLHLVTTDDFSFLLVSKLVFIGILSYLIFIPIIIYLSYVLLKYFGKKIIIACYLAYIIKIIPDVFINDEVNLEKMEQVDITSFPDDIQMLLNKYHLEESVYKEIEPGNDKNAALIGYGKGARMEIYGNFEINDKDELFSVFLHEIGHAKENTLLRKTLVYISLLVIELFLILFFYSVLSKKYSHTDHNEITENNVANSLVDDQREETMRQFPSDECALSLFSAFIILLLIYRMVLRQWLIIFYKVVSQQSEINSDLFAKEHHYGNELATALFNIVLESNDFLRPTAIYNFFRSGHPSISVRIEYLAD